MHKKHVIIGFFLGLLANAIGIVLYIVLFSKEGISDTIQSAITNSYLGKLISLGAILNLLLFFFFLRKRHDSKAQGVLLATLMMAIIIIINKV